MDIKVINKINKGACSMTTLKLGEREYPLTEKQWVTLISEIENIRGDLETLSHQQLVSDYRSLLDDYETLCSDYDTLRKDYISLEKEKESLEKILDDKDISNERGEYETDI